MRRVVRHCEAADRDFWPAALRLASSSSAAAAAGGSVTAAQPAGSEASAAEELAAADVWQLMGLARGIAAAGGSPSSSEQQLQEQHAAAPPPQQQASAVAEWAEAEAQQLLRFERGEAAAAQAAATSWGDACWLPWTTWRPRRAQRCLCPRWGSAASRRSGGEGQVGWAVWKAHAGAATGGPRPAVRALASLRRTMHCSPTSYATRYSEATASGVPHLPLPTSSGPNRPYPPPTHPPTAGAP